MNASDDLVLPIEEWEAPTVDWDTVTTVGMVPSAFELMQFFDQRATGHRYAKEKMVSALRLHLMRNDGVGRAPRLLLMGPKGFGKTTLAEAMLAATDMPALRIECGSIDLTHERLDLPPGGIVFLDGLERLRPAELAALPSLDDRWLVCGAITFEVPISLPASQDDLRRALAEVGKAPELAAYFETLVAMVRLSPVEVARTFAAEESPLIRAKRVISSLGGSFECDRRSIEMLAHACADGPLGVATAHQLMDQLLETVLRSPDPAQPWRLGDLCT